MSFESKVYFEMLRQQGPGAASSYLRENSEQKAIQFLAWEDDNPLRDITFSNGVVFKLGKVKLPVRILNCSCPNIQFIGCEFLADIEIEVTNKSLTLEFRNCTFDGVNLTIRGNDTDLILKHQKNNYPNRGLLDFTLESANFSKEVFGIKYFRNLELKNCNVDGEQTFQTFGPLGLAKTELIGCEFRGKVSLDATSAKHLSLEGSNFKEGLEINELNFAEGGELSNFTANWMKLKAQHLSGMVRLKQLTIDNQLIIENLPVKSLEVEDVIASHLLFNSLLGIHSTLIRGGSIKRIEFSGAEVASSIAIQNMNMKPCIYLNNVTSTKRFELTDLNISSFQAHGAKFKSTTIFKGVIFESAPEFFDSELFSDTRFVGCTFKDRTPEAEGAYRTLKHHMLSTNNWSEEQRFTSLELECNWKKAKLEKERITSWLGSIYHYTNRFGGSVEQPFYVLYLLFGFGILIYFPEGAVHFEVPSLFDGSWRRSIISWPSCWKGAIFSAINSLGPLKLHPSLQSFQAGSFLILIISSAHSIFSTYLWFLIFSWIRRRFRTH